MAIIALNTCLPEKDALHPRPLTFPISASSSIPFWLCHSLVLHDYSYCLIDNAMRSPLGKHYARNLHLYALKICALQAK
jgi:hypothetical protein